MSQTPLRHHVTPCSDGVFPLGWRFSTAIFYRQGAEARSSGALRPGNMPNTNVTETTALATVQDFMQIAWPPIQFSYDSSLFWVSALCHYAPNCSGLISGIQGVGIGTTPGSDSDS